MYVLIVLQLTDKSGVIVTDKKPTYAIIHSNSSSGTSFDVPEHILFTHYVRPGVQKCVQALNCKSS